MHWIVFMTSLCMYYVLCFVHVEHSVCHEPISVLINNIFIYIYAPSLVLVEHSLVLTLTLRELRHWPSIAGMLPQNHYDDEEDRRIGLPS